MASAAKQTRDRVDSVQAAAREDRRTVTDLRDQLEQLKKSAGAASSQQDDGYGGQEQEKQRAAGGVARGLRRGWFPQS